MTTYTVQVFEFAPGAAAATRGPSFPISAADVDAAERAVRDRLKAATIRSLNFGPKNRVLVYVNAAVPAKGKA